MDGGQQPGVDFSAVEEALRALGLLFGAKASLADACAGARDEAEAIRAYIVRERPHILASYDIESLIQLVRTTMNERARHGPILEQFSPRQ